MSYFSSEDRSDSRVAGTRLVSIFLAVAATLTSLFVTVVASVERGATWVEKAVWISFGAVILLSAHLLPAVTKRWSTRARAMVFPIWLGAILATGYTHATFFLNSQISVGEQRASALTAKMPVPNALPVMTRSRTQIAADSATTVRSLAMLDSRRCTNDCATIIARRKALVAHLDALKIEDAEAVRTERAADDRAAAAKRRESAQDRARSDPFMDILAAIFRVGADRVSLLVAVILGWLVDAVAVVSWTSVTRALVRDERTVAPCDVAVVDGPVEAGDKAIVVLRAAANEPYLSADPQAKALPSILSNAEPVGPVVQTAAQLMELSELAAAIRAGKAKPTLTSIQNYLSCTDGAAMALRRRLAEEYPELFQPQQVVA